MKVEELLNEFKKMGGKQCDNILEYYLTSAIIAGSQIIAEAMDRATKVQEKIATLQEKQFKIAAGIADKTMDMMKNANDAVKELKDEEKNEWEEGSGYYDRSP